MKQLIAFVMTLLIVTTFISVRAETYPLEAEGLQEWDIQENEVINMMKDFLIENHESYVCSVNREAWHHLNDEYDPDDYYSYLCVFRSFVSASLSANMPRKYALSTAHSG